MKRFSLRYQLLAITVLALGIWAAAVTIPFTFQAGEVISSEQMNENFAALNDGKQERVTGTCDPGAAIRTIDAAGAVECEPTGAGGPTSHTHFGELWSGSDATAGLQVSNSGAGSGLTALGADGIGVLGRSNTRAIVGVIGNGSCAGPYAIGGCSAETTAVRATSDSAIGLHATSNSGTAVQGVSDGGIGVRAVSSTAIGMWATSDTRAVVGTLGPTSCAGSYAVGGCASGVGEAARFVGGSGGSGSCTFNGGAGWSCTSDRNAKENFAVVDSAVLLENLAQMPINSWSMKGDVSSALHVGPTAQDFYAAFGLGDSDVTINTVDAQGISLAAIQGLYDLVKAQGARIEELEAELVAMRSR